MDLLVLIAIVPFVDQCPHQLAGPHPVTFTLSNPEPNWMILVSNTIQSGSITIIGLRIKEQLSGTKHLYRLEDNLDNVAVKIIASALARTKMKNEEVHCWNAIGLT